MQNWFFVQSAEYGKYYIEVDINGYGVYNIWIGMLHSDGSVGHQANTLTTSNKSSARRKYNKFIQDAEADSYGWNYKVPDLSWKFDINTELYSVQEYILSNPKNIKASSYIRRDSNMKKYVKASTNSDIRSGIIDAIDRASNTDPNVGATTWYELAETSDKIWAFVCAWLDLDGDGEYRLMGKIAYTPTQSAMSDYDYDWMMPYKENEDVYDTELEIDPYGDIDFDVDWWLDQWEEIKKIYVYPEEDYYDDIEESTNIHSSNEIMSASSGLRKMTQKQIKDYVRDGIAIDITNYEFDEMNQFLREHNLDKIAVSRGVYGMNGGLLQDRDTGEMYAITARNSALMMAF